MLICSLKKERRAKMNNVDGDSLKVTVARIVDSLTISATIPGIIWVCSWIASWASALYGSGFLNSLLIFLNPINWLCFIFGTFILFVLNINSDFHCIIKRIDENKFLVKREKEKIKVLKIFKKNEFFFNDDPILNPPWEIWDFCGLAEVVVCRDERIYCGITIELSKNVHRVQQLFDSWGETAFEWTIEIEKLMYDFVHEYSDQLKLLFNPLDEKQQGDYIQMLRGFFESKLESTGLVIQGGRFQRH
jgi:hypothetical protein